LSNSLLMIHANSEPSKKDVALYGNGVARSTFSGVPTGLILRAGESFCAGHAILRVYVDGTKKAKITLTSTNFADYPVALSEIAGDMHTLKVSFGNDYSTSNCDRNAYLDYYILTTISSSQQPETANPFAGEKLYVDPNHKAWTTIRNWEANGRYADAQQLKKIALSADSPRYFSDSTEKYGGAAVMVDAQMDKVKSTGSLPVLGTYAIPHRDCGGYSGGGFSTATQYRNWIDSFARGIGDRKAIVVLEPDALAGGSCLIDAQRTERYQLLSYAVHRLKANPKHHVYIDAGQSTWQTADTMISRLTQANIAEADGFTLNNANFNWTSAEIAYGEKISAGVGGKHFIVDTSRNGLGPYTGGSHDGDCPEWANPPGRALGARPTTQTGHPLVDAFLWLKSPGESDGNCGGFPSAGTWMPDYALGLARRAA
jgi:endoglucanase